MRYMSDKVLITLVYVLLIFSGSLFAEDWPVKRNIDLSSGFGDFRQNRFHAGVDIRTGGKSGESIFSPVDGYIHRIRASYTGYGKGLYIQGDNGYIYVFAHLKDFAAEIDSVLKKEQLASKRYFQDMYLPKDSMRVKKGEFIGYSGQTGVGAPHLHFEKRTAENYPLNPLLHDFELNDKIPPVFESIGFKQIDNNDLYDTGMRELEFDVSGKSVNKFTLDTVLSFRSPFGIYTSVYDNMRTGGMKQAVYSVRLYIDNNLYYESAFDTLDFDVQQSVNFEYKYSHAVAGDKRVRRLYHGIGNEYNGSRSPNNTNGIIGITDNLTPGYHKAKIVAEDCFGNSSTLTYDFIWTGTPNVYVLDSIQKVSLDKRIFYFSPSIDVTSLQIDSIVPFLNRGELWGRVRTSEVTELENGQIRCAITGNGSERATMKLYLFSGNAVIRDNLFSGLLESGKSSVWVDYEVLDDGLLVKLKVRSRISSESRLEIYANDSLLGYEYPTHFTMEEYRCFIPPKPEYKRIDKIGFSMSRDTIFHTQYRDSLNLHIIGYEDNQKISIKDMVYEFNKNTVYQPMYIDFGTKPSVPEMEIRYVSGKYMIYPEVFVCKNDFKVSYHIGENNKFAPQAGIVWIDEKKNEKFWLDTKYEGAYLTTTSSGGGTFAPVYDLVAPQISRLSIKDGATYRNVTPTISFLLSDDLSGIKDDQSIVVKLNGDWMIPEYDPESEQFFTKVLTPLEVGKHHLGIEITDKAGNKFEQYLNFFVKK